MDYRAKLQQRLTPRPTNFWEVRTRLQHFALINYALPAERLRPFIPKRFELPTFPIRGRRLAMLSVVPFLDIDFHFVRFFPFFKFKFGQTNHRVYVIDQETGEHCVWFFGTTLGSSVVHIARTLWRIPWHYARYKINCQYDATQQRYTRYQYTWGATWGKGEVEIEDTGERVGNTEGFESFEQMKLILTHPVDGFFYRLDQALGSYSIWHPEFNNLTVGRTKNLYFQLYERLGLLSREEMQQPHSVFLSPEIEFKVYLPPRKLKS